MGGSNFDQIAQAVLQQQKLMQDLQEQNNQLRQQLLDLRSGRGIFVLINGTRFALADVVASSPLAIPSPDEATSALSTTPAPEPPSIPAQEQQISTIVTATIEAETPTNTTLAAQEEILPSTEQPSAEIAAQPGEEKTKPAFLEDLMLSEFTSAMTSPLHTQGDSPDSTQHPELPASTNENENDEAQQQADLRRALIGSYMLD